MIQLLFSGDVEGACHLIIKAGELKANAGAAKKPDLTVTAPFAFWMDIMTGKKDEQQIFLEHKYQVSGDFDLLTQFKKFLGN